MPKAVILASGQGSNAQAILKRLAVGNMSLEVVAVLSDKKNPGVKEKADFFQTPFESFHFDNFNELLGLLKKYNPEWAFLAGYMKILPKKILEYFYDSTYKVYRVLNIHPSLLPSFPGLNAYEQAYYSLSDQSGITLHFVDEGVDTGPILFQKSFLIDRAKETLEDIKKKGQKIEHELYTQAIESIETGHIFNLLNQGRVK